MRKNDVIKNYLSSKTEDEDLSYMKNILFGMNSCSNYVDIKSSLYEFLTIKNSRIRLKSMKLIDYLFINSEKFRIEICKNLNHILTTSLISKFNPILPPPATIADNLHHFTLRCIYNWNLTYGKKISALESFYNLVLSLYPTQIKMFLPKPVDVNSDDTLKEYRFNKALLHKFKQNIILDISISNECLTTLIPGVIEAQPNSTPLAANESFPSLKNMVVTLKNKIEIITNEEKLRNSAQKLHYHIQRSKKLHLPFLTKCLNYLIKYEPDSNDYLEVIALLNSIKQIISQYDDIKFSDGEIDMNIEDGGLEYTEISDASEPELLEYLNNLSNLKKH